MSSPPSLSSQSLINDELSRRFAQIPKITHSSALRKLATFPIRLGVSKLLRIYAERRRRPVAMTARTFWGDRMKVVLPDVVSAAIYQYGYFEEGMTRFILTHLRPGMTFLDVGAHMGYFSLLAARVVGDTGSVHSFEPTPRTFKVLRENTAGVRNISVNNVAVFREDKQLTLTDYGFRRPAFNTLFDAAGVGAVGDEGEVTRYDVKATSIDNYVAATGARPDFIKIDAEGAEEDIVRGMCDTIKRLQPILTLEVGDDNQQVMRNAVVVEELTRNGYQAMAFEHGNLVEHQPRQRYGADNIFLIPQTRA